MLALAASYVDGQPYPLPRQRWGEIGLTDDSRARLDAAGWLRATEPGEIAFAHDRLLNWAMAKFLVHQHQRGDLKVQGLGNILANDRGGEGQALWRRLGYVPMDTVWLLGEVEQNAEPIGTIVARMEDSREFGSYGEHLYTDLLPTLGQRAVPILLARLNTVISGGNGDYRVRLIGQAFAGLARQDHVELTQLVAELLRSTTRDRQSVLIAVLTVSPYAVCLDRLWEIHRGRVDALEDKANGQRHEDYGCSQLREKSNLRDHVREEARRLLILIGGEGITTLLRHELEAEHYWVRHGGLNWAFVRRDDGIVERLTAIARRPLPRDADGKPESEPYFEFHQAMSRLAALGVDATLVDILLESGVPEVPTDLASMRTHQGPMPNALTERAAATLANEAATEMELRVALAVAWLSGNVDLVPNVRAVLRKADSASSVAGYACIALLALGDGSEEFARLAFRVARTQENARRGLNALSSLGDRGTGLLILPRFSGHPC